MVQVGARVAIGGVEGAAQQVATNVLEGNAWNDGVVEATGMGLVTAGLAEGAGAGLRRVMRAGCGRSFSPDTIVATPDGEQAIGSLQVGDAVTAYDPDTGQSSTQTVQHVWVNHDHDLLDVTLHSDTEDQATASAEDAKALRLATKAHGSQAPPGGETIHTTANHPWLTADRGWVLAGDLRLGERVMRLDGSTATVVALAGRPGVADYYNLTVSEFHTYAVGSGQLVVHNCGGTFTDFDKLAGALDKSKPVTVVGRYMSRVRGVKAQLQDAGSEVNTWETQLKPPTVKNNLAWLWYWRDKGTQFVDIDMPAGAKSGDFYGAEAAALDRWQYSSRFRFNPGDW